MKLKPTCVPTVLTSLFALAAAGCAEPTNSSNLPLDGDEPVPGAPSAPANPAAPATWQPWRSLIVTGKLPGLLGTNEIYDEQKLVRVRAWSGVGGPPEEYVDEAPTNATLPGRPLGDEFVAVCDDCVSLSRTYATVAGWADSNLSGACDIGDDMFWYAYYGFGHQPQQIWVHPEGANIDHLGSYAWVHVEWRSLDVARAAYWCDFLAGGDIPSAF